MTSSDKMFLGFFIALFVCLTVVVTTNIIKSWNTDQIAIKQGLVQKMDQGKKIWTRP